MLHIPPPPANFNNEIQNAGSPAALPPDFDPDQYPILGRHWFGWRSLGEVVTGVVAGIQFDRRIEARRSGA